MPRHLRRSDSSWRLHFSGTYRQLIELGIAPAKARDWLKAVTELDGRSGPARLESALLIDGLEMKLEIEVVAEECPYGGCSLCRSRRCP